MAINVVGKEVFNHDFNLVYELRKCKECSCSRCVLNGTKSCYIEVAIKELGRYEQAMDSLKVPVLVADSKVTWEEMDHIK
jgi:hypothetical protein